MQKVRCQNKFPSTVRKLFSFSFFSKFSKKTLFNLSFTVLVHYRFVKNILVHLESGLSFFKQNNTCSVLLTWVYRQNYRTCTFYGLYLITYLFCFIRVRSPLLAKSRLIYFPLVTKMFQFTRYT